ncbi:tRNA pseudouridine(55) synthase TruB [Brucepastera parasyntrophica]|uniref:tRNA pseudouridine(55) synthase TruB n=1 Tax=Brucepastera parasyntrophica TaxID=2880008 RepID=UPI00210BBBD7|nr:tRNA pseudouridine(55) synthase TruB [Brucepastera parasyntrophica]ULQ61110.1 tRNA pseudouridine(55) synthase TruB [Brucepastera parasyntrophica]
MDLSPEGIILFAKSAGKTSFSSLWQIKNALETKKVGHTGTLDSFADGLLVLLSGKMTRLAPYITACDKEYKALIEFGAETDTLDPDGKVIMEAPLPLFRTVRNILPSFTGNIMQKPPLFSAIHVDGERASDRIRKGEQIELPPRPVTVYSIEILEARDPGGNMAGDDSQLANLTVRVRCSKGTYIRSLARTLRRQRVPAPI